jgi:hypothetical protein
LVLRDVDFTAVHVVQHRFHLVEFDVFKDDYGVLIIVLAQQSLNKQK